MRHLPDSFHPQVNALLNIAIVDDDPATVMLTRELVGRIGDCTAHCFTDPLEALTWCEGNALDLLIVDYTMPQLDGLELIRRLRACPGRDEVPMLMLTCRTDRALMHRALESGATDFVSSIDTVELSARLRNLIAQRKSHLALTATIHEREVEAVLRLANATDLRDSATGSHIVRTARLSRLIAHEMGCAPWFTELLHEATPLHDIGKLGTPDHILLKPGKLTADEYEVMKQHAGFGHRLLKDAESPILQLAAEIALSHHEKFDGSGYPAGLAGRDIPLSGRIVAVADVFDALTSPRPYKPVWEPARAFDLIAAERGRHFDPECADAFLSHREEVTWLCGQVQAPELEHGEELAVC